MADKYKETTFSSMLLTISLETITRKMERWFFSKSSLSGLSVQLSSQNQVKNIYGLKDSVISTFSFVYTGRAF